MYNKETEPCSAEAKCDFRSFRAVESKVLYLKKLVIKSGVRFFILFVLVDAILQKVVYFKNKSGTGGFFWLYACILW